MPSLKNNVAWNTRTTKEKIKGSFFPRVYAFVSVNQSEESIRGTSVFLVIKAREF